MPRVLLVATVAWLLAMLALAAPRATGDASEYVAMASNLASLRPPALTAAAMDAFTARQRVLPGGFELDTRRLPELVGHDGRQDMPHMWTYALLAVPGVWLARGVGAQDAWGLVGLNVAILATMLWVAARRSQGPWTLLLFVGPFVWWLDKPMADLLIGGALGLALLLWPAHGPLALTALGVAAAQNPALGVVWLAVAAIAVVTDPQRLRSWRWWAGAIVGAVITASAPLYYLWHLGRVSPLTTYATAQWPSFGSLLFPLTDVNMGALTRFTPGAVAAAIALTRRDGWRSPSALPAAAAGVLLLLVTSQQPNRNNGGHPDLSRYVIWLWPLVLPWLLAMDARPGRTWRRVGVMLLVTTAAWSTWQFRPTQPERYRYPTTLAHWVWTRHPGWTSPIPEAFSERVSHREPGWAPVATPACEKVLLYEGAWPWACPPPVDAPASCRVASTFCYANRRADGAYAFVDLGTAPGVGVEVPERRWTSADDVSRWLADRTRGARDATDGSQPLSVRMTHGIARVQVWRATGDRLLIHAHEVRDRARVALRHTVRLRVQMQRADGSTMGDEWLEPGAEPSVLALPAARDLLIELRW